MPESETLTHSTLEKIPGIGPAKAKRLLAAFGSLRALSDADETAIAAVRGVSERDAKAVAAHFAQKKKDAGKTPGKKEEST